MENGNSLKWKYWLYKIMRFFSQNNYKFCNYSEKQSLNVK